MPVKMPFLWRSVRFGVAMLGALSLSSCNTSSFLSGASSMRIDVDVYKGPLANTVSIQKGQLGVILHAANLAVDDVDGQLVASMCRIGCVQRERAADFRLEYFPWLYKWYTDESSYPQKQHVPPEFYRNTLTPGVEQCAQLGIPQRRILDHDAWLGKTYKPYQYSRPTQPDRDNRYPAPTVRQPPDSPPVRKSENRTSFDRGYAENAHVLHDSLVADDEGCRGGGSSGGSKDHKCKGGLLSLGKKIVNDYGEVEAAIRDNFRNQNAGWTRFPEFEGTTYQVCPVYTRLRTQLKTVESVLEFEKKKALGFNRPIDQGEALAQINRVFGDLFVAPANTVCGEDENCQSQLNAYRDAVTSLKVAYVELQSATPAIVLEAGDASIPTEAYLNVTKKFLSSAGTAERAAKTALQSVSASLQSTDQRANISVMINSLSSLRAKLLTHNNDSNLIDLLQERVSALKEIALPSGGLHDEYVKDLHDQIAKVKANFESVKSVYGAQIDTIEEVDAAFSDAAKEGLSAYFATKSLPREKREQAKSDAAALKGRLNEIEAVIGELVDALRPLNERYAKQNRVIAGYGVLREKFKLEFSGNKPSAEEHRAFKTKLLPVLQEATAIISPAQRDALWPSKEAKDAFASIGEALGKAKKALEALETPEDWLEQPPPADPTPSANAVRIREALKRLGDESFPPSVTPLKPQELQTIQGFREALSRKVPPASEAGSLTALAGTDGLRRNFANSEALPSELSGVIDALRPDGLPPGMENSRQRLTTARASLRDEIQVLSMAQRQLRDSLDLAREVQAANDNKAYESAAFIAGSFRLLATAISYQIASVNPKDKRLLIDMAKTANMGAEFANQLTARANALSIQAGGENGAPPLDRRNISTGQYLRDTQPTAFLDMYDWMNAATEGAVPPRDRIRIAKRLFDDDNWARVNEVYASGAGMTNMAFIRDEIGNWNLKSFESDPSEITGAYTELGVDLVERAAKIAATGGASEAVNTDQIGALLQTAQASQTGGGPSPSERAGALVSSLDLETVRKELLEKLEAIETDREQKVGAIDGESDPDAIKPPIVEEGDTPEAKAEKLKAYKESEKKKVDTEARAKIVGVVKEYENLINALQTVASVEPRASSK